MLNGTDKYIETVAYLGKLYDHINAELFGGELVKPVITAKSITVTVAANFYAVRRVAVIERNGAHKLYIAPLCLHSTRKRA